MRPVATVPRPVIENTSSTPSGRADRQAHGFGDLAVEGFHELLDGLQAFGFARQSGGGRATDDLRGVAGELVLFQEVADFHLDQVQKFFVVQEVDLVQEDDNRRYAHLARQQDVLAGLRHRAVGGGNNEDRAVHLGGSRDHVFDKVGVPRAVDVRVVALVALVLDVRHGDRDRLRRVADGAALGDFGIGLLVGPSPCWLAP